MTIPVQNENAASAVDENDTTPAQSQPRKSAFKKFCRAVSDASTRSQDMTHTPFEVIQSLSIRGINDDEACNNTSTTWHNIRLFVWAAIFA